MDSIEYIKYLEFQLKYYGICQHPEKLSDDDFNLNMAFLKIQREEEAKNEERIFNKYKK